MSKMNHSTQWSSSDVGGLCWVSDPAQAYIEARVTSVEKGVVRAEASDGRTFDVDLQLPLKPPSRKQKEPPRRILQRVPLTTNNGVENMDNLQSLQEASILDNIQHRFRMDLIYTNTGPILIAMNPFKRPAASITPSLRRRRVDGVWRRVDGVDAHPPTPSRRHSTTRVAREPNGRRRRRRRSRLTHAGGSPSTATT
jgi:hypothetical protein